MKTAIRHVKLMADERTRSVRMTIRPNEIEIGAQSSEEGEANEKVAADYTGEEVQVGFNAKYLQNFSTPSAQANRMRLRQPKKKRAAKPSGSKRAAIACASLLNSKTVTRKRR